MHRQSIMQNIAVLICPFHILSKITERIFYKRPEVNSSCSSSVKETPKSGIEKQLQIMEHARKMGRSAFAKATANRSIQHCSEKLSPGCFECLGVMKPSIHAGYGSRVGRVVPEVHPHISRHHVIDTEFEQLGMAILQRCRLVQEDKQFLTRKFLICFLFGCFIQCSG